MSMVVLLMVVIRGYVTDQTFQLTNRESEVLKIRLIPTVVALLIS